MKRLFLTLTFALGAVSFGVAPAEACPMCKEANESQEDDSRPRAYMYSILFMLAVPATLATGFGIGFYRLSKQRGPEEWPVDSDAVDPGESK